MILSLKANMVKTTMHIVLLTTGMSTLMARPGNIPITQKEFEVSINILICNLIGYNYYLIMKYVSYTNIKGMTTLK